jgi:hypothetical protein
MQAAVDGAHDHRPGIEPDPDLERNAVGAVHVVTVTRDALLHGQRRITRSHGVVFMGQRRAEEGHNPIPHDLVDGALVAVHGLDHALQDRVQRLLGLLGMALCQQLHGPFEISE